MSKTQPHLPDMLPLLSRGKHRNPRKGACFMELASYLAGERWSDHPACTHSLLASVARLVNDHTSDEGRPHLAELIPAVIGLTGDDLHIDALISLRCATIALPVAAADRQRVLAVSVLVCERVLARLDGRGGNSLSPDSERALGAVPEAAQWAGRFTSQAGPRLAVFRRQSAPDVVRYAVEGAAHALIADPDVLLRRMLVESIDICAAWTSNRASGVGADDATLGGSMPANRSGGRRLTSRQEKVAAGAVGDDCAHRSRDAEVIADIALELRIADSADLRVHQVRPE